MKIVDDLICESKLDIQKIQEFPQQQAGLFIGVSRVIKWADSRSENFAVRVTNWKMKNRPRTNGAV